MFLNLNHYWIFDAVDFCKLVFQVIVLSEPPEIYDEKNSLQVASEYQESNKSANVRKKRINCKLNRQNSDLNGPKKWRHKNLQ